MKQRAVLHGWRGKGESSCNSSGKTVRKEIINIGYGASKQLRQLGWDLLRSENKENNSEERFGVSYF